MPSENRTRSTTTYTLDQNTVRLLDALSEKTFIPKSRLIDIAVWLMCTDTAKPKDFENIDIQDVCNKFRYKQSETKEDVC